MSSASTSSVTAGPQGSSVSEVAQLPELTEQESHQAIELVWRFFCSLRLTLANLLGLFLAMIAGTFVNPQNDSLMNIERAFATPAHTWHVLGSEWNPILWSYRTFELYDLFHSWWFTLLLTSLALNLIACSIERLPRIYYLVRYPERRLDRVVGLRLRVPPAASSLGGEVVAEKLRAAGYRVRVDERDGGADVFAERGRYARFGVWVVHVSLLLILGGGIVGRLTAFEGTAEVPQAGGEADAFIVRKPDGSATRRLLVDESGTPFSVRCDDFRLKEFEPGRPKAFESDLRIVRRGPGGAGTETVLAAQTITVNHPLKYAGLTFYQASYRQMEEGMRAKIVLHDNAAAPGSKDREILAAPAEAIEAAEGLKYQVVDYQADFAGQGPAVQFMRTEEPVGGAGEPRVTTFWVFANRPEFDRDNRPDRFSFQFGRLTPFYATGLQIARDPSTPVVYTGCFLLFLGIGIAFYTAHKRLWAQLRDGKLSLGGAAHRNAESFAEEFDRLCEELGLPRRTPRRAGPETAGPAATGHATGPAPAGSAGAMGAA